MTASAPPGSDPALRRRQILDVFPIVAFRGLTGGMPILIGLYIAHRWGLAILGSYTFASSLAAVGLMIVDWGCTRWLPRELTLKRSKVSAAAAANALRLFLAAGFLLVVGIACVAGLIPLEARLFALELALLCPISIFAINGASDRIVTRETGGIAGAVSVGLAVFGAGVFAAHVFIPGPHGLVAAYIAGKTAESLVMMRGRSELYISRLAQLMPTAIGLGPFAIQGILGVVYSRLFVFVVERYIPSELGLVGAASALQNVILLFPLSIGLLNYPSLTRAAARGDTPQVRRVALATVGASLLAITAGALALFVARNAVSGALHIPRQQMPLVGAYVAVAYLTSGTTLAGVLLQSMGRERLTAGLSFLTIGFSFLYQLTLIRWFGLPGVLMAVAASEATSLVIFGVTSLRALRRGAQPHWGGGTAEVALESTN